MKITYGTKFTATLKSRSLNSERLVSFIESEIDQLKTDNVYYNVLVNLRNSYSVLCNSSHIDMDEDLLGLMKQRNKLGIRYFNDKRFSDDQDSLNMINAIKDNYGILNGLIDNKLKSRARRIFREPRC